MNNNFSKSKEITLGKLKAALSGNKVDKEIFSVLNLINKSKNYFTSSSCAGRIVLLELPEIGDKKQAEFLGKWHRTIESCEFLKASEKAKKGQLWLLAQPPIIHIVANSASAADELLKLGISCGFKHSGIKSIQKNIVVELCSTERLDAPIGKDGKLFCKDEYLDLLVNISNDVIQRSRAKLNRLEENLKANL